MITQWGPLAIGAVIGWMLYFFMRLYSLFSPKTLVATIAAILGGTALHFVNTLSASGESNLHLWYFLGLVIGFFSYALYVGILSLLYTFGVIKSRPKFEVAAASGANIGEHLDRTDRIMEFEELLTKWNEGILSDEEIKAQLTTLEMTREQYKQHREASEFEIKETCLKKFEKQGLLRYLPVK